jgi:hypothetical protein
MLIMRISMLSGEVNEMDLDITPAQLESYELFGVLLQDAFPNLSPDEREFIKTGITPEEWDDAFGGDL